MPIFLAKFSFAPSSFLFDNFAERWHKLFWRCLLERSNTSDSVHKMKNPSPIIIQADGTTQLLLSESIFKGNSGDSLFSASSSAKITAVGCFYPPNRQTAGAVNLTLSVAEFSLSLSQIGVPSCAILKSHGNGQNQGVRGCFFRRHPINSLLSSPLKLIHMMSMKWIGISDGESPRVEKNLRTRGSRPELCDDRRDVDDHARH
jgi:hypothetical protein